MTRHSTLALAVLVLGLSLPATAQVPDISGRWTIESTGELPMAGGTCHFSGQITIHQSGSSLTGNSFQELLSGPAGCAPNLNGMMTGMVDAKGCVDGQIMSALGTGSFSGCPGNAMDSLVGDFSNETGPFAGGSGTWMAAKAPALEIPTLSAIGLTLLTLLTLAVGGWLLLRRAQA